MSYHAFGQEMSSSRGGPTAEAGGAGANYSIPAPGGSSPDSGGGEESTDQATSDTPSSSGGSSAPYYAGGGGTATAPQAAGAGLSAMTLATIAGVGIVGYLLYTRIG